MSDTLTYKMMCDCGAVVLEAQGTPIASVFCHCSNCRELRPVEAGEAVAWQPESVTFLKGEQDLKVEKGFGDENHIEKYSCPSCGEAVYNTNRFGSHGFSRDLIKRCYGGELPDELQPTMHIFYEDRVKDVEDDLPKFKDVPVEYGGSGVMLDNQGNVVGVE